MSRTMENVFQKSREFLRRPNGARGKSDLSVLIVDKRAQLVTKAGFRASTSRLRNRESQGRSEFMPTVLNF